MSQFGNAPTAGKRRHFVSYGPVCLDDRQYYVTKLAAGKSRDVFLVRNTPWVVKMEVQCRVDAPAETHALVQLFGGRRDWRANEHELQAFKAVGAGTYAPQLPNGNALRFGFFENAKKQMVPVCALFVEALANPDLQMPFREAAQRRDVAQLNSLVRNGVLTIWQAGQAGVVAADMTLDNLGVRDNGDVVICDLGEWTKSDAIKMKKATTNFLASCTGMLKPFPIILDTFQWASGWCKPALAPPGFIDGGSEYLIGLCC